MNKRIVIALILVTGLSVVAVGAERLGRGRGLQRAQRLGAGGFVAPAQIWRLTDLSMQQRQQINEIQVSTFTAIRDARESGKADRREMAGAVRDLTSRLERVVTPAQLDRARQMPRGQLTPEELLYYPITSLPGLDSARRAKIDAIFAPALADARDEAAAGLTRGRRNAGAGVADPVAAQQREAKAGEQRLRRIALFEVLDALLTTDQMVAVKQFLPEQLRNAGLREKVIYKLPSISLEQESQARAIFAALDDETAADQARLKAINNELRGGEKRDGKQALVEERRQIVARVTAREKQAYADLSKVLTPDQMKQLAAQKPGPLRPVVFTPEAIRSLPNLTADQQKRIRETMVAFQRETADERREVRDLRGEAKGGDIQSMEMAGVRDQLRKAALVLDVERDRVVRTIADTLTGEQLARLVASSVENPAKGRLEKKKAVE